MEHVIIIFTLWLVLSVIFQRKIKNHYKWAQKENLSETKAEKDEIKVKSFFLLNNFLFESAEKFLFYFEGFLSIVMKRVLWVKAHWKKWGVSSKKWKIYSQSHINKISYFIPYNFQGNSSIKFSKNYLMLKFLSPQKRFFWLCS